jgi:hypothetical protein
LIVREADFKTFVYWHDRSGDRDPAYPVLARLSDEVCVGDDERVSFALLYVAYYDIASALTTWNDGWRPGQELSYAQLTRPTGTERRSHRNLPRFAEHIAALGAVHHHFGSWDQALWPQGGGPRERWSVLQDRLCAIRGNGRWAAYKTGEILATVVGWDIEPTDAGHAFSSGPRHGLVDLFPNLRSLRGNDDSTVAVLDEYTERLVRLLRHPVEQVETALCDWHSVLHGHYYVGHDIDLMLHQLGRAPTAERKAILIARQAAFEPRWLGEVSGWGGVRKELRRAYADRGVIEWWP